MRGLKLSKGVMVVVSKSTSTAKMKLRKSQNSSTMQLLCSKSGALRFEDFHDARYYDEEGV